MEEKPHRGWVWTMVLLVFLVVLGGGLFWAASRLPPVSDLVPWNCPGLTVQFVSPEHDLTWPADATVPLAVFIQGAPALARIELWANSRLVDVQVPPVFAEPEGYPLHFNFHPGQAGRYYLTAVAVGVGGATATSDVLPLLVSQPVGWMEIQSSQEGETLPIISHRENIAVESLAAANPGLDPLNPLPPGTAVRVPQAPQFDTSLPLSPSSNLPRPQPSVTGEFSLPDLPLQLPGLQGQPIEMSPSGYPSPVSTSQPTGEGGSGGGQVPESSQPAPLVTGPLQNFWFQVRGILPLGNPQLPKAPNFWMYSTSYDAQTRTCRAYLNFLDQSDNEDGFLIYRAPASSGQFERVASLSPNAVSGSSVVYYDSGGFGDMTYLVAAFNTAGENRSQPVTLEFDARCADAVSPITSELFVTGQISYSQGFVSIQLPTDLAYLYVKIAELPWERIPEQGKFLSGTGVFDLDSYLESRIEQYAGVDFEVYTEVWGWVNGAVQKIGAVKKTIHRSVLLVCSRGAGQCTGSGPGSGWVTDLQLPEDIPFPEQYHLEFAWQTGNTQKLKNYKIDVRGVTGQFGSLNSQPGRISLDWKNWKDSADWAFSLRPAAYLYNPEKPFEMGKWGYAGSSYSSNFFMKDAAPGSPFILTVQVLPETSNNSELPKSNLVTLRYRNQKPAPPPPTLAPNLPSLYDLKLDHYQAPLLPHDADWGCVIITNTTYRMSGSGINMMSDFPKDPQGCSDPLSATCNGKAKDILYGIGQRICPAGYNPPSDWEVLVDGIEGMIELGYNWLANQLDAAKGWVVNQVADALGCEGVCRQLLEAGLNAGITALTGLPPSLPNFDALASQGIEYAVEITAQEMGAAYCPDEICRSAIRKGLEAAVQAAKSKAPSPGCVDEGQAHARGKEPLCLPAGATWRPAVNAIYQPGSLELTITRKPGSGASGVSPADADKYSVEIRGYGTNDTRVGDWFPICGFNENPGGSETGYTDAGGGYKAKRQINEPLQGDLFKTMTLQIPWLAPGQSITVPVVLDRALFLRLNHVYDWGMANLSQQQGLQACGDDWPYLYYDGTTQLSAEEICQNAQGEGVACGSKAELKLVNPSASAINVEPPVASPSGP